MIAPRKPTLDESNRLFTAAMIGGGGVAGSTISVLFAGALLAGILRLWQGRIALPRGKAVLAIGASFAAYFLADALSTAVNYTSPSSLLEGVYSNIPFLIFLISYGRLSLSRREDVLTAMQGGVVAGSIGALVYALIQTEVLGLPRAEGLAGNPGPFALVCIILYSFATVSAVRGPGRIAAWSAIAAACAAGAVLLSGMRALWPLLLIAPVIPLLMFRYTRRAPLGPRMIAATLVLALGVLSLSYGIVETRVVRLIGDMEDVQEGELDNSLGRRLRMWQAAGELIVERPIFGHGPAEAAVLMSERASQDGLGTFSYTHAHNLILNAWMRSGILGVFALLAVLFVPVIAAHRAPKDDLGRCGYAMMLILTLSYVVSGLFNLSFGQDIMDILYIYAMICATYLVFGSSSTPRVQDAPPLDAPP